MFVDVAQNVNVSLVPPVLFRFGVPGGGGVDKPKRSNGLKNVDPELTALDMSESLASSRGTAATKIHSYH